MDPARRRALAWVVVATLVVTAGCSSLLGPGVDRTPYEVPPRSTAPGGPGGTGSQGTDVTEDPANSGTATPWLTPGRTETVVGPDPRTDDRTPRPVNAPDQVVPGVTAEVVWSAGMLANAHRDVLENRSFRVRFRRRVSMPDRRDPTRIVVVNATVGADRRQYRVTRRVATVQSNGLRAGRVEHYWGDDGSVVGLQATDRLRRYVRVPPGEQPPLGLVGIGDPTYRLVLARILEVTRLERIDPVVGAETPARYRIVGSELPDGETVRDSWQVRNLSVVAVVDTRGLVTNLSAAYERRIAGEWRQITLSITYRAVGSADPTPPVWLADARRSLNRSSAAPSTVVDPGRVG